MKDYEAYTAEEIARLAYANDKNALYEYGRRAELGIGMDASPKEADRYYKLAAQLGSPEAYYRLGVRNEKDRALSQEYFRQGSQKGSMDCTYRYALTLLDSDFDAATELLTFGAINGGRACAEWMAKYYEDLGNVQEAAFFRAQLEKPKD